MEKRRAVRDKSKTRPRKSELIRARAAAEVGFELLATATISSDVERTERKKGQRRTEHALLLEVP